jgi:hypothetical protein
LAGRPAGRPIKRIKADFTDHPWRGLELHKSARLPPRHHEIVSMSPHDKSDLTPLSAEILRYLRAHPQAADTVDGIVLWWLPRQRYDEAVDRVQHALDDLVARGWVDPITLMDGTVLYADRGHNPSK